MRKKVWYYKCDCGEGRLEEIAKTRKSGSGSASFFDCNLCSGLYWQKHYKKNYGYGGSSPLAQYYGGLTKDDIKQYAPNEDGNDINNLERRIMEKKNSSASEEPEKKKSKPKKTWFYKCDCEPGILNQIAKTKAQGREFLKFYGCHECSNVYWQRFYGGWYTRGATKLLPYNGSMSREEIKHFASGESGSDLGRVEKQVLKKAKATSPP